MSGKASEGARARGLTMSLKTPETVGKLQEALRVKAKASPNFRFYVLYDKVYRRDVLEFAYRRCRSNAGAAGVDGQTFEDVESYGLERWLDELALELRERRYRPEAVKRVWIPKEDGGSRPLGIPTVRDRVVQTAAFLVVDPIFDADLQPEQHAYRAGRGAHDAVREVHAHLDRGLTDVVDADLSGYFDSIPHSLLMKCVARRISDGAMLHLIRMQLDAPVEETDAKGRKRRTTRNRDEGRGTPQGGVLSPLLANLYMRRFVLGWKLNRDAAALGSRIVNYADDFVICCPPGRAEKAMDVMRGIMGKLRLTVNEKKTRRCDVRRGDRFTFLGFTFGRQVSWKTGRAYTAPAPAGKKVRSVCRRLSELTDRRTVWRSVEEQVGLLNPVLLGWANYFRLGYVTGAWRIVQMHACRRLHRWLQQKRGRPGRVRALPLRQLYHEYGLVELTHRLRGSSSWANAR